MIKFADGESYHVYNRGAHKERLFLHPDNYQYCLRLLHKYVERYLVSLIAYCLMPNHYHLVLRQEMGGSISRCIQTLFNAYTQGFNKVTGHKGTLFQGEAKRALVESDQQLLHLIRYIHLNPVAAGIVERPEEWRFSDYPEWIGFGARKSIIQVRAEYFADGRSYSEFVRGYLQERDKPRITKYLFDES